MTSTTQRQKMSSMTQLHDLYHVENYIDTFALGHYARVLLANDLRGNQQVAFKVMRPEHILADGEMRWEFRAFGNEAEILHKLQHSPHIIKLRDCGFVESIAEAPVDGDIQSYGTNVSVFTANMQAYASRGWRPYLALEYLPRTENLFYLMKPDKPNARRRLPSEEGLSLALQFGNVLTMAHENKIVYLDHKLEHVYWDGQTLRVIDFNSSKQLTGVDTEVQEYVKDVHNLCVGILYPLFTGMSPQKTALRPQAGGMEVVEGRYSDVQELDFMVEPLLSKNIQLLLQRGAAQQIPSVGVFVEMVQQVAAQHGRDFQNEHATPANRQARESVRKGLQLLRDGENAVREARDIFREAMIQDGLTEDLEDELRRLVKAVNDFINERVIP